MQAIKMPDECWADKSLKLNKSAVCVPEQLLSFHARQLAQMISEQPSRQLIMTLNKHLWMLLNDLAALEK